MGAGDYYTQFTIVGSQMKTFAESYSSGADPLKNLVTSLFAATSSGMLVATVSASQKISGLGQPAFLSAVPLMFVGKGFDPATNSAVGNGCFYSAGLDIREPFIRHDGSGGEDYEVIVNVRQTNNTTINAINSINSALQLLPAFSRRIFPV